MSLTQKELNDLIKKKTELLKHFFAMEPPGNQGEDLLNIWDEIYDDDIQNAVLDTVTGPSDDATNYVFPYEKLQAVVKDGLPVNWKWPRIWQKYHELTRRGPAFRDGDPVNLGLDNPNPHIIPQHVVIVGGGPVGIRLAIELKLGGHKVTLLEKRRERRDEEGNMQALGFTNRINRPHVSIFLRNDLDKLNGKDFMSSKMCYPIFTQADTTSIGIDELQLLLMKNALLLGVDFRLGVGFENAEVVVDPKNSKPRWKCTVSYDAQAAAKYKVEAASRFETFDVLMGCDGARSRVRESQPQIFGDVDKRNFKKMIGVVANIQKVPRKRLMEIGFKDGREPTDMKRAHESSKLNGKVGLNYYKASYHNYVIFTPDKEMLEAAGVHSSGLYTFHAGRDGEKGQKSMEKENLKQWIREKCKEAGIPVDEAAENGGFVPAPNDAMAFDFSEIWKCKKNMGVELPPLDHDVERDGEWAGAEDLCPPVGLVGDSVTEPFWLAGVGLKRGWNGVMDTCFIIDNLYNLKFSGEHDGLKEPAPWDDHMARIKKVLPVLYDCSQELKMTKEGHAGEFADGGVVMTQIRKHAHDALKPQWHLEVDPYSRYEPLAKLIEHKYKGAKALENEHPVVKREVALRQKADSPIWNGTPCVSINGKELPKKGAPLPKPAEIAPAKEDDSPGAQPGLTRKKSVHMEEEVERKASIKVGNLHAMLAAQMEKHVQEKSNPGGAKKAFKDDNFKEFPQKELEGGYAQFAEKEWDHMTENHLGPAQRAELQHVRNMQKSLTAQIEALTLSLQAYQRAERELVNS